MAVLTFAGGFGFGGDSDDILREFGGLFQLTAHSFLSGRPGRAREETHGEKDAELRNLGWLTEANHLGNVAYRVGRKLEWDAKKLRATNCPACGSTRPSCTRC